MQKKKALHTIFFKKNLHLNNSKPLVSAKQMNFRLRPRLLVFLWGFFWMSYKNLWMIMSNGNADSSKATAFGAFVGFSLPPSDANKSIPHQKAGGPVRVVSLFRHASDAQMPTDHKSEPARPDTFLSPSKAELLSMQIFLCYSPFIFLELPPSSTFQA